MSRRTLVYTVALLAVVALALPVFAGPQGSAMSASKLSTTITVTDPVTFAGMQLKPGNYFVEAKGDKVSISQDGRKIGEANATWQSGQSAPPYSSLVLDGGNTVKEVHFGGKMQYVSIS